MKNQESDRIIAALRETDGPREGMGLQEHLTPRVLRATTLPTPPIPPPTEEATDGHDDAAR
jgi:hypothetical protein